VEKLTQDSDFLQSEIGHLSHAIADINKEINAQTSIKKTLVLLFTTKSIIRTLSIFRMLKWQFFGQILHFVI
jgi:hypothetical protein